MADETTLSGETSHTGLISEKSSTEKAEPTKQLDSWRFTVRAGVAVAAAVFLINLGALIWALTLGVQDGAATVFEGSCTTTKRITFWVDLLINIISTLLLGASNNCTQLLVAPTRKDIGDAHTVGQYLDVGVWSVRNLMAVNPWRKWLCAGLFLSSIPLHLLYNSVMYSALSASNYVAAIVTDDFLQGASWNTSRLDGYTENIDTATRQVARLQSNVDHLTRLENEDCIRAYGTNFLQSKWKNVLVVSDANVTGPLIIGYYHQAELLTNDLGWICGKQTQGAKARCDTKTMLSHPTNWTIAGLEVNQDEALVRRFMSYSRWDGYDPQGPYFEASVKYCLAETAKQHCTIEISIPLLGVVLLCNLIKVICLSSALLIRSFHPMATIGDLISSCLSEPDPSTRGIGPITAKGVRRSKAMRLVHRETLVSRLFKDYRAIYFERSTSLLSDYTHSGIPMVRDSVTATDGVEKSTAAPVKWKRQKNRWYQATSMSSWVSCMVLCAIAWFTGVYLLTSAINYRKNSISQIYTLSRMWQDGVGAVSTDFLIGAGGDYERPLMENVLLANTPQLAISFIYVLYNNCLTRMMLAREYASYASHRKPLRVSRPAGEQRSTYRMQLPYRYSVPLMIAMIVLHWLVARSIFLVEISVFDYDGNPLNLKISACGFSAMAIVLSLFVSGVIIVALLASAARKLEPGMPLASSCSLAITAACHTSPGDGDAALLQLKYGVVIAEEPEGESDREHACFSSKEVTPLVDGHWYN